LKSELSPPIPTLSEKCRSFTVKQDGRTQCLFAIKHNITNHQKLVQQLCICSQAAFEMPRPSKTTIHVSRRMQWSKDDRTGFSFCECSERLTNIRGSKLTKCEGTGVGMTIEQKVVEKTDLWQWKLRACVVNDAVYY